MAKINYSMEISLPDDKVRITFTGEEVNFEGKIRPRHLKIVSTIVDLMREFRKSLPEPSINEVIKENQ